MIFFVSFKHSNSFFSIFFFLLSACTPKPHSQSSLVGEDPGNKVACTPAGYYCTTYPPTENDQYKHLSNVSEMIVLIILGSTHQMSILNGLAHQLYTLMADVWFSSNTKLFCELQYGAKRRWKFKESRKKTRSIKGPRWSSGVSRCLWTKAKEAKE